MFLRKKSKVIDSFSKNLYDSTLLATKLHFTPSADSITVDETEVAGVERYIFCGVVCEFIYFIVHLIDIHSQFRVCLEKERASEIVIRILENCLDFIIKELISDWPPSAKSELIDVYRINFNERASIYHNADLKLSEGDQSVFANCYHIFGKKVAGISGESNNLKAILEISALANSIYMSEYPFESLRIDSFIEKIK